MLLLTLLLAAVLLQGASAQFLPYVNGGQIIFNPQLSSCAQQCESSVLRQQTCMSQFNSYVYDPYYSAGNSNGFLATPQINAILPSSLSCFCQSFTTIQMQFAQCLTTYVCPDAAKLQSSVSGNYQSMCNGIAKGLPASFDYGSFVGGYLPFATGNSQNSNAAFLPQQTRLFPTSGSQRLVLVSAGTQAVLLLLSFAILYAML